MIAMTQTHLGLHAENHSIVPYVALLLMEIGMNMVRCSTLPEYWVSCDVWRNRRVYYTTVDSTDRRRVTVQGLFRHLCLTSLEF
jgi:hypothetical protein